MVRANVHVQYRSQSHIHFICERSKEERMLLAFTEHLTFENILWGILALIIGYLLKQILTPPPPPPPPRPKPKPIELKEFSKDELKKFNGEQPATPIYLALKGKIYDVSRARSFYGPGSAYGVFAGHDASNALAKGVLEESALDQPIDDLTPSEKSTLDDWVGMYESKYPIVGWLEGHPPIVTAPPPSSSPSPVTPPIPVSTASTPSTSS